MSSFESMVRAEIANSHPSIQIWNKTFKDGSIGLFMYNAVRPVWSYGGSDPEEGWITVHPEGIITISTLWKGGCFKKGYQAVLDVLKPDLCGYHRCATDAKYHPKGKAQPQDGTGKMRWAKNLNRENYIETLSHYFHAMKRV